MPDDESQSYVIPITLPDGAIPEHALAIVAFMGPEGESKYVFRLEGNASLASILGLIEIVKMRMLSEPLD